MLVLLAIPASLLALLICFGVGFGISRDVSNIPLCNKGLYLCTFNWFDSSHSSELPNVDGNSAESLRKLMMADDPEGWATRYQYVPGLTRNDPGDLVLAYLKTPTRWRHHAAGPPSRFAERKWILIPLDFTGAGGIGTRVEREMPDTGEEAERVSLEELKSRLRKTLKYLQDNDRPHWQTVMAENEEFLKSLESE